MDGGEGRYVAGVVVAVCSFVALFGLALACTWCRRWHDAMTDAEIELERL